MPERINRYSVIVHLTAVAGILLHLAGIPLGGSLMYVGFLMIGVYYFVTKLKLPEGNLFHRIILLSLAALVMLLSLLSFIRESSNFLLIVLIILLYGFLDQTLAKKNEQSRTERTPL
ncbi:MAG: hypothetical protein JNM57_13975 [Cyclobacteriaceae bacterium]|nr:hypothetical protein [Cyclobacteriaceae bacterium]